MTRPEDELAQHARALRGLARALVGAEHADDVVQDAAVQVLRRPPAAGVPLFAWLAGVVRNRAMKHHRGERRRVARELRAGERAAGAASTTPLDAALHRETVARLDQALLGLPQPYQDTLLWRYYEGLTPAEIAARTGTPVATVKSRLQRGLALVRERLDADGSGRDWRAALVTAFGIGKQPVAAVATAAAVTGITLMTAKLAFGAVVAVLVGFYLWPRAETPVAVPAAVVEADADPRPEAGAANAAQRDAVAQREAAAPPTSVQPTGTRAEITIVGRCVDEAGASLAAVRVEGRVYRHGGGRERATVAVESQDDGTFSISLPTDDDCYQSLRLLAPDRCESSGSIHDAVAGERRDLGDLVLPLAHRVRGRIVDVNGAPQQGVPVTVQWDRSGRERQIVETWVPTGCDAKTDELGAFAITDDLPPGRYWVTLGNRSFAEPGTSRFDLGGEPRERVLELVVKPAPPACRGVVVRSDGAPIAGATVSLEGNTVQTGPDGRFEVLPRSDFVVAERRVAASAPGYLRRNDHVWRTGDASEQRIELRPAPGITLRVVDGDTGAAVERYAARVVPPNGWNMGQRAPEEDHPGGVSRVLVDPGQWFVLVTPGDGEHARSAFVPVELPTDRDVDVTVRVWPEQQRRLVVTDGERPVVGVEVELLDPGDIQVRRDTEAWPLEDCRVSGPPTARIVQKGTTDADGALLLRGPRADLALRLSGGGLALQVVQPIRLDDAGDLVVAAQRGARLRGRLVPVEVARHVFAAGQVGPNAEPVDVGVDLVSADNESLHRFLEPPFPIDAEGAFDIHGVPAGTWHVVVVKGRRRFAATTVDVPEGGDVERDVDISAITPAVVTLRVLVDGAPAKDAFVNAMGWHAKNSFGDPVPSQTMGRTDENGSIHIETYVGDLELHVRARTAAGEEVSLRTDLHVPRAGPQEHVADLRVGSLDLTVLGPDGAPAAGVVLREAGRRTGGAWTTDESGRVRVPHFAAGTLTLEARPRGLSTDEERQSFSKARGWQALEREWVVAGVLTVAPGAAVPQRLTLPAAWDR